MTRFQSLAKPCRTHRKLREKEDRIEAERHERDQKAQVRRRDRRCRFPMCGCGPIRLRLEVSHERHKGMGGNRPGDRSNAEDMVLLCEHRHQHGRISRHAGTMKAVRGREGYDGPVQWLVDVNALGRVATGDKRWRTVATEVRPGVLAPLTAWQRTTLEKLAEMEL